ncbi:MAG: lamin tail domain-containing protein [Paludibacter sp.]
MKKTTFFKSILLAFVIMVGSASANAQLLNENFSYTVGQDLTANGWNITGTTATPTVAVSASSITYAGYLSSGIGAEVSLASSGQDVNKTFTAQTTGTVYASCLVNITSATTTGDYFFHLGATAIGTTYHGRVFVKKDASNNLAFGISRAGLVATAIFTPFSYALNTTYLLVLKYTIVAGATNDVSAIYINPTLNAVEPVSGWITSTDTPTDLANIGSVALRQGTAANAPALKIDGIRVATTWSDIVGAVTGTPTISVTPSTLSGFTYSGSGPSAEQSFTAGGTNLTNNITLTAPTDYEISTGTGGSFIATSPITLTQTGGTVATTTIYARLKAGLTVGSYNSENIAVASTGATAQNVTCNGSVTAITPTITVTEATVAAFSANIGSAPTKTINVSGANLTGNITLALSGTNADQFSLSQTSLTQTGGSVSNTVITITYTPTTTGPHTATLTLSSAGATDVTRSLSGTAGLSTPVAAESSVNNNSGFTANWSAVPGATDYVLSVYIKTGGGALATDLFISEYVEGTSNNKAIEIFNGTGAPVDLSAYSLKKQTNGAGAYTTEQLLTGTLANNDVFVLANTSANATILGVADLTNNTTMTFNGNDAVALFKGVNQLDEVGIFNQVANWGLDQTLIRKSSITSPKATYDVADWDVQATDYITNLGSHTMTGSSNVQVSGSPFTVTGTNSYVLTGLQGGSTYYYTVVAKNATVTTASSNEIIASTMATGLSTTQNSLSVSASDGIIRFTAESGQVMELYNAVGQKLLIKTTTAGLNSIPVAVKGLVVVKVGNQIAKVVL